jgi:hypothetical protein
MPSILRPKRYRNICGAGCFEGCRNRIKVVFENLVIQAVVIVTQQNNLPGGRIVQTIVQAVVKGPGYGGGYSGWLNGFEEVREKSEGVRVKG